MTKLALNLNDDVSILNAASVEETSPGIWHFVLPGEYLPYGKDFVVEARGKQVTNMDRFRFCAEVRREHERETVNPIAKAGGVGSGTRDSLRDNPNAPVGDARSSADSADQEATEDTLEELLESQVNEWLRRSDQARDTLARAKELDATARRNLAKAKRALKAARGGK